MKKIFHPTTFKMHDFTTCHELNYHFNFSYEPDCYDSQCEATYQIDPHQMHVKMEDVSIAITSPSVLSELLDIVPNTFDFSTGYQIGFADGFFTGSRKTFAKPQSVTWSYLAGYEYGIQLGAYYRQWPK